MEGANIDGGGLSLYDQANTLFGFMSQSGGTGTLGMVTLQTSGTSGTPLHWYSGGAFKRFTSSARYKTDIDPLEIKTDRIFDLEVKSYTSKSDSVRTFGLIAEEVYEVAPDIINLDDKKRPDSIREPLLNYMMLAEIQKLRAEVNRLKQQR